MTYKEGGNNDCVGLFWYGRTELLCKALANMFIASNNASASTNIIPVYIFVGACPPYLQAVLIHKDKKVE